MPTAMALVPTTRRVAIAALVAALAVTAPAAPASGVDVIRSTGETGAWEITDDPVIPGARCWYDVVGVGHLQDDPAFVGTAFLLRVRTTALGIHGTQSELRSVGYRLLLQRRGRTGWRTTQRGPLKSGAASDATPVVLPGSAIRRNPKKSPDGGRYRAVLKLLWWDETAEVEGVEVGAIEYHRRTFDDPIGGACRARVPISG